MPYDAERVRAGLLWEGSGAAHAKEIYENMTQKCVQKRKAGEKKNIPSLPFLVNTLQRYKARRVILLLPYSTLADIPWQIQNLTLMTQTKATPSLSLFSPVLVHLLLYLSVFLSSSSKNWRTHFVQNPSSS